MKSEKRMFLSFVLNLVFTFVELVGALITNSVALLSDCIHDISDSVSIGISIMLEKKAKKKADYKYTYGYYRFSLLGGLIASVILVIGSTLIIYEAVLRIINPETVDASKLIYFAIVGVVVNGVAAINIFKGKSINEKVISLHLLEDVLGWFAILLAAILIKAFGINSLDTYLSLAFTVFILYQVVRRLKQIMEIFLEKAPLNFGIEKIKAALEEDDHVIDIHHIHLWSLEGNIPIITLHALIRNNLTIEEITKIQNSLHEKLKDMHISHATIQMEFEGMECNFEDCSDLQKDTNQELHIHHH